MNKLIFVLSLIFLMLLMPKLTYAQSSPSLTRCANVSAPVPSRQGVVGISKINYTDCNSNINAAMQQIRVLVGGNDFNGQFGEIPISTGGNGLAPGQQHVIRIANVPAGYGVGYTACDITRVGQCRTNPITTVNVSGGTGRFNVEVPGSSSVVDVVVYLAPPSATNTPPPISTPTPATASVNRISLPNSSAELDLSGTNTTSLILSGQEFVLVPIDIRYSNGSTVRKYIKMKYTPPASIATLNILVLKYLPTDQSGNNVDSNYFGSTVPVTSMSQWMDSLNVQAAGKLTQSTKYHGYKNPTVQTAIRYQIVDTKEFRKPVPTGRPIPEENDNWSDYKKMLSEDVSICDYVDRQNVKEVWIWSYQVDSGPNITRIHESNMSMGRTSRSFWNRPTHGNVSNSGQWDDLPQCEKTYIVYNLNARYYPNTSAWGFLHIYGHQLEALFSWIDPNLWEKFTYPVGFSATSGTVNHCGSVHSSPNSVKSNMTELQPKRNLEDYLNCVPSINGSQCEGYQNFSVSVVSAPSDCEDWKPDGGGQVQNVNCTNWFRRTDGTCPPFQSLEAEDGLAYRMWWRQNIPGYQNNLTYRGKRLRNWWDFSSDLDAALAQGKSLSEQPVATPTTTPTNTPVPTATPTPTLVPPAASTAYCRYNIITNSNGTIHEATYFGIEGTNFGNSLGSNNSNTVKYTASGTPAPSDQRASIGPVGNGWDCGWRNTCITGEFARDYAPSSTPLAQGPLPPGPARLYVYKDGQPSNVVTCSETGTPRPTVPPTPTPIPPPAAPTNVVAVPGCNGRGPGSQAYISITWRGPAEADFYDLATSDEAVVIRNLTSGTYIFTNPAYNGNQFFKVRSVRGGVKSAYTVSNTINQADCTQPVATNTPIPPTPTPTTAPTPTPLPPPAAPTNVVAVPGCNGRGPGSNAYISITWRGPAEADSYDVATSNEAVVIRNITSAPYIFTNAAYNGNQWFKVRSVRGGIKSAYTASNTINQADCTQPIATNTPIPPTPLPTAASTPTVTQPAACQPLPKSQGNANNDCVISDLDFNIWSSSYGSTTDLRADFNNNGKIDLRDFNIWRRNRAN